MKRYKLSVALLTGLVLCSAQSCGHRHLYGEWQISEASCITDGHVYRACALCGEVEYNSEKKKTGHSFADPVDDIVSETRYGTCSVCGVTEEFGEYVPPSDIPRMYIYGDPNAEVIPVEVKYFGDEEKDFYALISIDANESNAYYKKDYDFHTFTSSDFDNELSLELHPYVGETSSYSLKGEYYDKSSVRNLSASELWYQVVDSRKDLDENLKTLDRRGAESGYPVIFYTNGNYKGIYNLCTPNDQKLFKLNDANNQTLVYSFSNFGVFDLQYEDLGENKVPCTVIWPTDTAEKEKSGAIFEKFMEFVLSADDVQFERDIGKYLDVDAAIDYLICVYAFGADANVVSFCNWVSFDNQRWIPSMYNLTYTFGIDTLGDALNPEGTIIPKFSESGVLMSSTNSALWDKLCRVYASRISERYKELRGKILTEENVRDVFEKYYSMISQAVYESEFIEYADKAYFGGISTVDDISAWFSQKVKLLDKVFIK